MTLFYDDMPGSGRERERVEMCVLIGNGGFEGDLIPSVVDGLARA